jgi:hypothetical protein
MELRHLHAAHWGWDPGQRRRSVDAFEEALFERGLLVPISHTGMFDINKGIRSLVLASFAMTLQMQLANSGIALHLATDSQESVAHIASVLFRYWAVAGQDDSSLIYNLAPFRSRPRVAGGFLTADRVDPHQITEDLCNVGADLSAVPLDELLDFREQNGEHYRAYAAELRKFMASQIDVEPAERKRAIAERSQEIRDRAAELRKLSRQSFGLKSASLLLSLTGAAWTLRSGDSFGALLAGTSATLQGLPTPAGRVSTYSYLMRIRDLGHGRRG